MVARTHRTIHRINRTTIMSQSNEQNNAPSLMHIMRSVAESAGMTTADLMAGGRRADLCHARAAVYKIAAQYGYTKDEIMFYLDRNRTVAYNYEANLNGHLLRNIDFKALCDDAIIRLNKHPHRVEKSQQLPPQNATEAKAEPEHTRRIKEPVFTDWKGQLGWTFTAEECRREWYTKRAAEKFMKTYGQPPHIKSWRQPQSRRIPTEMTTAYAAIYLGVSPGVLVKGVQLGRLQRFKKPRDTSYWFHTAELDRYKIYLEQNKRTQK